MLLVVERPKETAKLHTAAGIRAFFDGGGDAVKRPLDALLVHALLREVRLSEKWPRLKDLLQHECDCLAVSLCEV